MEGKTRRLMIYRDISRERDRQTKLWGYQEMPISWPHEKTYFEKVLCWFRSACDIAIKKGCLTYYDVIQEEVYESAAARTLEHQREEMLHVAAVAVQALEYLDKQIEAMNG